MSRHFPDLAPHPDHSAPDEARLTAVAELATLLAVLRTRRIAGEPAQFASELEGWLRSQAKHASLTRIIDDGPPLALTAPLVLRAHLGDAVEPALPAERLLAAAQAQRLLELPMPAWRRWETASLIEALSGADARPPEGEASPMDWETAGLSALYGLTHEVFHLTRFGTVAAPAGGLAEDLATGLALAVEAGHQDLAAEMIAARRCIGVRGGAAEVEAWRLLCEAHGSASPIAGYHVRLTTLMASALGAPRAPITASSE